MLAIPASLAIADETTDDAGLAGQVRLGYINTDDNVNNVDTLSLGGHLGYTSPTYHGMSAGAVFYTTNPIAGINTDGFFLDSNNKAYTILGQAWVNADIGKTSIKLGRQGVDTPFADTDDIGMIQDNFEGLVITNNYFPNTELFAAHLSRWAGVDSPQPEKFLKLDNNHGVNVYGINYQQDKWGSQLWFYDSNKGTDISYLELGVRPIEGLELNAQYADQKDTTVGATGSDGNAWGAQVLYEKNKFAFELSHNSVSNGAVTNGFGGGPFFTSGIDHTIADVVDQKATAIGVEYSGSDKWTVGVRKINFKKGEDELGLTANYQIRDNLAASMEYADMGNDGTILKAFLNYDF